MASFRSDLRTSDGLSSYCIDCSNRYKREWRSGIRRRKDKEAFLLELHNRGTKNCSACELEKPLGDFGDSKASKSGLRSQCRECYNAMSRRYYSQMSASQRERKQVRERAALHGPNGDKMRQRGRDYNRRIRAEFIAEYGGKCECCDETEPKFLTLEHKNNDGRQHRAEKNSNHGLLLDLKKRGWPKDAYGILCFNCNTAKAFWGECPHKSV